MISRIIDDARNDGRVKADATLGCISGYGILVCDGRARITHEYNLNK